MKQPEISIVIPAYNESQNLKHYVLDEVYDYLKKQTYTYEVLVVDDGSKDDTVKLVTEQIKTKKGFRLIENVHGGKALTVITGIQAAQGQITLFTDMDQATPIQELEKFLPKFKENYNVVIGSRSGRRGAPLIRKVTAWGFSVLRNIILGLPFKDTQCGFKAFDRQAIETVFPILKQKWEERKSHGAAVNAGFDAEMLFIAKKYGLSIAEVPVDWHHVGSERVQIIKDAVEAIKELLRIRFNDMRGLYKLNQ